MQKTIDPYSPKKLFTKVSFNKSMLSTIILAQYHVRYYEISMMYKHESLFFFQGVYNLVREKIPVHMNTWQ